MSLINYIEPINAGSIFVGLGMLILTSAVTILIVKFFNPVIAFVNHFYMKEVKYSIVEEKLLYDLAQQKGINIEEELLKREVISKKNRSFRKKIEEDVFNKMFPQEAEKK